MKKLLLTLFLVVASVAVGMAQDTKSKAKPKTETVTYVVDMHCQNCVTLKFDPSKIEEKTFVETINKSGYTATKKEEPSSSK